MSQPYSSVSRRPIASLFRRTAWATVSFCVRRSLSPDLISCLSVGVSAGAAVCFWRSGEQPLLLLLAPLLCLVRLWFNMLDGMVALASGRASLRGEIFNELPDRISDLLIFVGVAHSGFCSPLLAYWAAILALLTAYVGTLGQAVARRREYGGIMSKPWRMVALHLGAWTSFAALRWMPECKAPAGLTLMDWTCIAVVAGCLQTIGVRLSRTFAELREKEAFETRRGKAA